MRHGVPGSGLRARGHRAGVLVAIVVAMLAAGCTATAAPSDGRLPVVTTTTVLADLVQQVGGSLVDVQSLVPANGDPHTFEPRPSDMGRVAGARLIFMNGLGLDDWLNRSLANAVQGGTPIVRLAENLPGVEYISGGEAGQVANPHLWMYVPYAEKYVDRIEQALAKADPAHAADYASQAGAFRARLAELDGWVRAQITTIPVADRAIVSFHDAFPYYARGYGLRIVGVAVAAPGQEPSASWTAQLIDAIRANGIRAVFSEAQFPARVLEQIAAETGASVVADLYDGSLGNPPITSYEALIRWDTQQIAKALAP